MYNPKTTKYIQLGLFLLAFFLVFLIGFILGQVDFSNSSQDELNSDETKPEITGNLDGISGVDADVLWEAWNRIEENHLFSDDLDRQEMLYAAVDGIIEYLDDDYSQFLSPEETENYFTNSSGQFEGIGAFLRFNGDYTVIDTPIDDFPAQEAGLKSGDVITEVDGTDVQGKSSYEVAELIKGPRDTDVDIKIFRPESSEEIDFTITRQLIDIENVRLVSADNGVGQIKIYRFNESDTREFKRQWDNAVDVILNNEINNIIIDLRNNPGGRVDLVKYITEEFLGENQIIMKEEDKDGNVEEFKSTRNGRLKDKNIVVLINEGSASASEIFTGALQDYEIATVIGRPTIGKGVEQTVINLSDGSTMHIVFQKWLTPNDRFLTREEPLTPDIDVEITDEEFQNGNDPQLDRAFEEFGISR